MSRFLIVTWDGAGNLASTLGIAERLADDGHDVRLLGHRSIRQRYGAGRLRFRGFEHTADFDSTQSLDVENEISMHARRIWFSDSLARDVSEELEREPVDVLVADCLLATALSRGQAAGLPTVALFHVAFCTLRAGPFVDALSAAGFSSVNGIRARYGLAPVDGVADIHDSCALCLVAAPKEFEPEMSLPPNVRFVGPISGPCPVLAGTEEVAVEDGPEPLIVVSLSTSYQDQAGVLQRLVDALAPLPVRVVVTTGPAVDPQEIHPAANTQLARFVPHDRLLPHASLVVTHGGLGTTLAALSHGVPQLCVPMGRDQFFNAGRVQQLGVGWMIDSNLGPGEIGNAVRALLADGAVRRSARQVAGVIARYQGARDAAETLEHLAAAGRRQ